MTRVSALLILVILLVSPLACRRSPTPTKASLGRHLYVAHKSRLTVYDIDDGHRRLRRISLPDTENFKGIVASILLGRVYVASNRKDEILSLDLESEAIIWRRSYCAYIDSMAITRDGKTLYVPCRHAGQWWVLDAKTGDVKAKIETGRGKPYDEDPIKDFGPHNTVPSADGSRMYLSVMTDPFVYVADTATHKIVSKIGPFSRGVRPFVVNDTYLFANVDGLLGFEVADLRTGRVFHRVEAKTPPERIRQVEDHRPHHHTPSHGIALRPGTSELWLSDDVHGYLYVYDASVMPPRFVQAVALFEKPESQPKPGWISFSIDGRYAYASCNAVVDAQKRTVTKRIDTSERLLEIQFENRRPVRASRR